jgi:hypothetical protein
VVFPTPPFWFATAITSPMVYSRYALFDFRRSLIECATPQNGALFHVEHAPNTG